MQICGMGDESGGISFMQVVLAQQASIPERGVQPSKRSQRAMKHKRAFFHILANRPHQRTPHERHLRESRAPPRATRDEEDYDDDDPYGEPRSVQQSVEELIERLARRPREVLGTVVVVTCVAAVLLVALPELSSGLAYF